MTKVDVLSYQIVFEGGHGQRQLHVFEPLVPNVHVIVVDEIAARNVVLVFVVIEHTGLHPARRPGIVHIVDAEDEQVDEVDHAGIVDVPPLTRIDPVATSASCTMLAVPLPPVMIEPVVVVPNPVPPLATGSIPVTSVVCTIFPPSVMVTSSIISMSPFDETDESFVNRKSTVCVPGASSVEV